MTVMCPKPKIVIPFLAQFKEDMLTDNKTATTRNKRYGDKGDRFDAFGETFELTHVVRVPLHMVAHHFYKEEGFITTQAFIECWEKIHPKKGYYEDIGNKWLHLFRRVGQ